jgi:hypothetical protein
MKKRMITLFCFVTLLLAGCEDPITSKTFKKYGSTTTVNYYEDRIDLDIDMSVTPIFDPFKIVIRDKLTGDIVYSISDDCSKVSCYATIKYKDLPDGKFVGDVTMDDNGKKVKAYFELTLPVKDKLDGEQTLDPKKQTSYDEVPDGTYHGKITIEDGKVTKFVPDKPISTSK